MQLVPSCEHSWTVLDHPSDPYSYTYCHWLATTLNNLDSTYFSLPKPK